MATRHVYLVRHGAADPFGELTGAGKRQSDLIGQRLSCLPIDAVWHSPLPRAVRSAGIIGTRLPKAAVRETPELVDHVPYVPEQAPPDVAWLVRDALDAPPVRWLGLNCGNTALTVVEYRDESVPAVLLYNDMGHLPADLRWTGFRAGVRP
ncbi:phosphoglycerate mutase family protein [Streptomyces albireticuli]|uniref:Histidine phosphatase family protein n=1 Tax=Streptomyces albireticuli TaxID=1940 RepID=A0A2A2D3V6_9ACTN|nr:phosphoglycerate mutase family protein [Streptomyces albireticuli]MCD9195234.1 histidine phosphatase family protein [Streptomyces albireticuli]PAU46214.1 histidine phosphatase family protein [Streptomyces albireticuli]